MLFSRFTRVPGLETCHLSSVKVLAVALFISSKFSEDTEVFYLDDFRRLSGIQTRQLEEMELAFAEAIDYRFYVSLEQCQRVVKYGMVKK